MRPRGLRSPWRKATPTYWYEPGQPSRMVERARAIAEDVAAGGDDMGIERGDVLHMVLEDETHLSGVVTEVTSGEGGETVYRVAQREIDPVVREWYER